jgi:hypothetical protein
MSGRFYTDSNASGLIAAGCDVVTVQRALGHVAPSITLNTYSHYGRLLRTARGWRLRTSPGLLLRTPCGPRLPNRALTWANVSDQR